MSALISNAPIIIPKSGDALRKKDSLISLTGKRFLYETRLSPRAGAASYFSISQAPVADLSFERLTGKLSGIVRTAGVFTYRITASNSFGEDYVDVEISVRKRGFTNDNFLAELTEDPQLQTDAWKNLNVDPDMLPVLQDLANDTEPWIRNDFSCMVGFSGSNTIPAQIDVQLEIDAANSQADSIQNVASLKLSENTLPEVNVVANGSFVATQFWKDQMELTPSISEDFGAGSPIPSWSVIDGQQGDADKIQITPPSNQIAPSCVLIEGSLTVRNGLTVANQYYDNSSSTFNQIKTVSEATPATKIQHYDIMVGELVLKLPVYTPGIPGL